MRTGTTGQNCLFRFHGETLRGWQAMSACKSSPYMPGWRLQSPWNLTLVQLCCDCVQRWTVESCASMQGAARPALRYGAFSSSPCILILHEAGSAHGRVHARCNTCKSSPFTPPEESARRNRDLPVKAHHCLRNAAI